MDMIPPEHFGTTCVSLSRRSSPASRYGRRVRTGSSSCMCCFGGQPQYYRGCGRCRRRADQTQSVSRAVLKFRGYLIPAEAVSVIRDVVSDCAVADPYGLPNGDGRFVPTAAMVLRRQRCGHPRDVRSKDQELISSRQPVEQEGDRLLAGLPLQPVQLGHGAGHRLQRGRLLRVGGSAGPTGRAAHRVDHKRGY